MAAGDLDEAGVAIGRLQEAARQLQAAVDSDRACRGRVAADLAVIKEKVAGLEASSHAHQAALDELRAIKNRGAGLLLGVALASGGTAASLVQWGGKLFR